MAKKVLAVVKMQLNAGEATVAPPVGPSLGQHGVNSVQFVKEYNERTQSQAGSIIPCEVTVYADRSYSFITKTPPTSDLLRKAAGVEAGSGSPREEKVGEIVSAEEWYEEETLPFAQDETEIRVPLTVEPFQFRIVALGTKERR